MPGSMKKVFFYLLALLPMAACHQAEMDGEILMPPTQEVAEFLSAADAVQIANDIAAQMDGVNSRTQGRIARNGGVRVVGGRPSRSDETFMYVVEYDNEKGFALISSNPASETPVLAVIDDGTFDEAVNAGNPGFDSFLSTTSNRIKKDSLSVGDGYFPPFEKQDESKFVHNRLYDERVSPRTANTLWGQIIALGSLCPNGSAGCVPVAIAMAMAYCEAPSAITYTCPDLGAGTETLNWRIIKVHKGSEDEVCDPICGNSGAHGTLAKLGREIGYRANSIYKGNFVTSTPTVNILSTAKNLLGDRVSDWQNYEFRSICNTLDNGIALMNGDDIIEQAGHAWIADGYISYVIQTQHYTRRSDMAYIDPDDGWVLQSIHNQPYKYIHMNWGWDGKCNGYYIDNAFRTLDDDDNITHDYIRVRYAGIK